MIHTNFWDVGNWCIHTVQKYIESPFLGPTKGVEVLNYAQPFVDALARIEGAQVWSEASWDLYNLSPEDFEERLRWADVIVFGDVETKCLILHPHFRTNGSHSSQPTNSARERPRRSRPVRRRTGVSTW